MSPLDWASLGVVACRDGTSAMMDAAGIHGICKAHLRAGDHIYAWKLGWTYNLHGIVVHTQPCSKDCVHDTLNCRAVVRFKPPGAEPGRIEVCSLAAFAQGREVHRCQYGISHGQFLLYRSGTCSTQAEDPRALTVLRALSVVALGEDDGNEVEYNLLVKNSELLARWCKLGEASGIRRFLSAETARSLQTSHGRFIRLGLAATVATAGTAVMAKSAMSTGAGAAALADAAVIGSSTALSLRSAFRQLAVDAVRTPNRAQETLRLARHAAERTGLTQTLFPFVQDLGREEHFEVQRHVLGSFVNAWLSELPASTPAGLQLDSAVSYRNLTEILVDVLEAANPRDTQQCAELVQIFFDTFKEDDGVGARLPEQRETGFFERVQGSRKTALARRPKAGHADSEKHREAEGTAGTGGTELRELPSSKNNWVQAARGHAGHQTWEEIVQAALSWKDVADSELFIAVHVFSMLSWAPMCAFRACHSVTANAFELWAGQPQQHVALSWVHVPINRQSDCLRFLGQHCRNARQLSICDTTRFGERQLLRLVCGMRLLESLEVDAPSFGGDFPEPQRLLDRLAKYCPRLQHLALSFRPENPSCRTSLELRALAWLGRRLLTLDLGAVAIRVWGGTRTIAACCPLLQRSRLMKQLLSLCAQLCQQSDPRDAVDPVDIARGCSNIQDLDLAPVDWGNKIVEDFTTQAPGLRRLVLRHVALDATAALLAPLVALGRASQVGGLVNLHLALHARSDTGRALFWLEAISKLKQLRSLCLDYAAPLTLKDILSSLTSSSEGHCSLMSLTVHGCHGVGDAALGHLAACAPKLEQVRLFPDSWRQVGSVTYGLRVLVEQLALRSLALSSLSPLDGNQGLSCVWTAYTCSPNGAAGRMLQLVTELPGLFRRGADADVVGAAAGGLVSRLFEDPFDECEYRLRRLEDFVAELNRKGWDFPETPIDIAAPSKRHDVESAFLQAVPDKGLEIHEVWKTAWEFCHSDCKECKDEALVRHMAVQAVCRRFAVVECWLRERLGNLKPQRKDLVVFLPVLRAELEKLKAVLAAVTAGSSGAEALTAKALAARDRAEARYAAAAASVTSLAQRGPNRQPPSRPSPPSPSSSPVPSPGPASSPHSPLPPIQPPSSAVEGIQRWVESVRQTGSVAASSNDRDWRRQLDFLRAGLTGTKAVCLSPDKGPRLPSLSRKVSVNLEDCPICLEPLRPPKQMHVPLIPLPCGHSFHAACASQQKAFDSARALRMRSLSLFAPMTNGFLQTRLWSSWRCLRHLWLGPHKLMQKGVSAECLIDDVGLQSVVETCSMLRDFTVASHRITDEGVRLMLSACRELCRLRCGGCGITDASLQFLATLTQPRLERFSLWFSGVTSQGLHQAEEDMPWTYFDVDIS
eukprot:s2879_g4.t5